MLVPNQSKQAKRSIAPHPASVGNAPKIGWTQLPGYHQPAISPYGNTMTLFGCSQYRYCLSNFGVGNMKRPPAESRTAQEFSANSSKLLQKLLIVHNTWGTPFDALFIAGHFASPRCAISNRMVQLVNQTRYRTLAQNGKKNQNHPLK